MNHRSAIKLFLLVTIMVLGMSNRQFSRAQSLAPEASLSTAFTYQGRLVQSSSPAKGTFDFEFYLFDAPSVGSQVGGPVSFNDLVLSDGYFTVLLDFGGNAFNGQARYLEVRVRLGSETGGFTILAPRQELTAAPYAQYARTAPWSGLSGVPAGFADNLDNDTTYSAGTGLMLNGGQFSVNTTTIQSRISGTCAIGSSIRVVNADGTVSCESDNDTTYTAGTGLILSGTIFNADTTYLQRRVTGTCAVGSTVSAVHADGSVECQMDAPLRRAAPPDNNQIATLDSAGVVGSSSSITVGADGLGLISYYDYTNGDLRVAHCNDIPCSSATTYTLDSAGDVGGYTSITLGADGLGLISYYDYSSKDLKVAHCNNIDCSSATTYTLDSAGDVGLNTSITIGADGLGLISYIEEFNWDLKVAHCNDIPCSSASTYTLDSAGAVDSYSSITLGADGLGLISYYDDSSSDLKVAHCDNIDCFSATTYTLDSAGDVGSFNSITVGADGLGLISYFDNTNDILKVAHCDNFSCSSASTSILDSGGVGMYNSITIGADGLGLISYFYSTNGNLCVAHCSNAACSAAITRSLDGGDVGLNNTSITLGTDGLGLISYYDFPNNNLKVLHCSNAWCGPHFRRR
jgi:hypothetical protein